MGPYYYICNVLKIVHTNGISLIKLSQKPVYTSPWNKGNEFDPISKLPNKSIYSQYRVSANTDEELIYKKGETIFTKYELYMSEYMELIQEFIKEYANCDYESKNTIIRNNSFFSNDVNGESLKSIDDIIEIYLVELED